MNEINTSKYGMENVLQAYKLHVIVYYSTFD